MKKDPAAQESERAGSASEGVKGLRACAGWTDQGRFTTTCCGEAPCQWGDHPCDRKKPESINYSWHSTPQLWCATRPGYDGAPDARCPIGFGKNKEEAAAALVDDEEALAGIRDGDVEP